MNVKNRKCISRLSRRAMRASKKRNAIAVVAIILTTLLFTSLFTVALSINSSYQNYTFRQIGGYNHGAFKEVSEEQIAAITAHPKIKAAGERINIGFMSDGVFAKLPAEVSFMDDNCTQWSYCTPSTGRNPQSGREISMDTAALKLLGIEPQLGAEVNLTYTVGDKVQSAAERTDTFTLVGFWDYDDISPVHFVNISRDYAKEVEAEAIAGGLAPFRTDLNVMLASSIDISGTMQRVERDLGYVSERGAGVDEAELVRIGVNWGYTTAQLGEKIDPQTVLAIAAFLLLVVFTGYLIIYNIFQISVTGDIRFYGLLKTIGVTPRQLRRIIRQQALSLCVVGIPVGLALGYAVGAVATPIVMGQLDIGAKYTDISVSPLIFAVSALFALFTVLLSCARPGRIAAKVSPVEATKYTEVSKSSRKRRATRGAKVHQMAFANLGRNKSKTLLVIVSLALSVVLLNVLVLFVGGFDMEKFLSQRSSADFIVSTPDYFRYRSDGSFISEAEIADIENNTTQSLSGAGYTQTGVFCWMGEDKWRMDMQNFGSDESIDQQLSYRHRRGELIMENTLLEGLDTPLFEKLTLVEGELEPIIQGAENMIAVGVDTDDYGNIYNMDFYPPIGSTITLSYTDAAYYIDSRTGELAGENTPPEYWQHVTEGQHDVDYTVCAYVIVPTSITHRYNLGGAYNLFLSADRLAADSGKEPTPMVYIFDTPDAEAEAAAEAYLAKLTAGELAPLMYESKATLRAEFEGFQSMFLLLGGLLCAIIGLVGVLNFVNAIMTGIISRRREFAVLQAVGMENRQIKAMLIYEGLFYSLGSAAAALVFAALITPLAGHMLESMFWFFSARFTIVPVLAAIPVFALLGWLIPSVMYSHSARSSVVERLREAE